MIKCPKCQATLPVGSTRCQFCGASFAVPPPAPASGIASDPDYGGSGAPKWVWPAYHAIAIWWILGGILGIVGLLFSKHPGSPSAMLGIVINALTALVGLGLILRVEAARGVVNVLCFLQIFYGVCGLLGGFVMSFVLGLLGALAMILSVLHIALAILMIFVIGETESRAPNF